MPVLAARFVLLLLLILPVAAQTPGKAKLTEAEEIQVVIQRLTALTNQARERNGLCPLVWVPYLEKAASSHSREMLELRYFSHQSPTPGRSTSKKRINLAGGWDTTTGENIYRATSPNAQQVADAAMAQWLSSPAHRKNILNPAFNSLGIGIARRGHEYLITQDFSRQTIVVLDLVSAPAEGGCTVTLRGRIREGSPEGAVFVDDLVQCYFQADGSGLFTLELTAPAETSLAICQKRHPESYLTDLEVPVRAGLRPSAHTNP